MKTFIWIAGHSAVGKDTFLTNIEQYAALLEIDGPILNLGLNPRLEVILEAAKSSDTVTMKWQTRGFRTVLDLIKERPRDRHIVVHIRSEVNQHKSDFEHKHKEPYGTSSMLTNVSLVEAYRPFVSSFFDIANIRKKFYVVGVTHTAVHTHIGELTKDRVPHGLPPTPLANEILYAFYGRKDPTT